MYRLHGGHSSAHAEKSMNAILGLIWTQICAHWLWQRWLLLKLTKLMLNKSFNGQTKLSSLKCCSIQSLISAGKLQALLSWCKSMLSISDWNDYNSNNKLPFKPFNCKTVPSQLVFWGKQAIWKKLDSRVWVENPNERNSWKSEAEKSAIENLTFNCIAALRHKFLCCLVSL